mmetsp:Transcript_13752/g.32102  ORF Transcript_13752/g.32102 Transcript_13752/m.32102 type:complete len:405 (-) Transcript_13752:1271-2485(-)
MSPRSTDSSGMAPPPPEVDGPLCPLTTFLSATSRSEGGAIASHGVLLTPPCSTAAATTAPPFWSCSRYASEYFHSVCGTQRPYGGISTHVSGAGDRLNTRPNMLSAAAATNLRRAIRAIPTTIRALARAADGSATSSTSPSSALISRIARRPRGCSEGHGRRPGAASLSSARAQRGGSNASTAPSTAFCVEPTASSTATDTTDDTSLAVAWIVACTDSTDSDASLTSVLSWAFRLASSVVPSLRLRSADTASISASTSASMRWLARLCAVRSASACVTCSVLALAAAAAAAAAAGAEVVRLAMRFSSKLEAVNSDTSHGRPRTPQRRSRDTAVSASAASFCAASTLSCTIAIIFLEACEFRASVSAVMRIDSAALADAALTSSCSPSTYTSAPALCTTSRIFSS